MSEISPVAKCPECGYGIDDATGVNNSDRPADGDVSICLSCGSVGFYVGTPDGLIVRHATPEETVDVLRDPKTLAAVEWIKIQRSYAHTWPGRPDE